MIKEYSKSEFKKEFRARLKQRKRDLRNKKINQSLKSLNIPLSLLSFISLLPLICLIAVVFDAFYPENLLYNLIHLDIDLLLDKEAAENIEPVLLNFYYLFGIFFLSFLPASIFIKILKINKVKFNAFFKPYFIFILIAPISFIIISGVIYIILGCVSLIIWIFGVNPNWLENLKDYMWYLYLILCGLGQLKATAGLFKAYAEQYGKKILISLIFSIIYYYFLIKYLYPTFFEFLISILNIE